MKQNKVSRSYLTNLCIKYGMNQSVQFHDGYNGTRGKTYTELYHDIVRYEREHNIEGLVLGHICYSC